MIDRHVVAVTVTAFTLAVGGGFGLTLPTFVLAMGLALTVAVVGLPHGGLDHLVGRAVYRPWVGRAWPLVFLGSYLGVGALVVLGWSYLPLVTIALFFLLSALHFAETEQGPIWRATLFASMVIWLPLIVRPEETLLLLNWVTPTEVDLAEAFSVLRPPLLALAGVAAGCWLVETSHALRTQDAGRLLDSGRLLAFALMFAFSPVLVSFAVAFCGWHSLRELGRLARQADPHHPARGFRRVLILAAPASIATLGLVIMGMVALGSSRITAPAVVQGVFLGLSAVAVPHILLHWLAGWCRTDPFADHQEFGAVWGASRAV